ncbi:MAG: class I SAM-dependent methyltransferase [Isosphaeraceae bacterium]|nr:class I SAM-dependent methyltransferase [Isosphaeraceae bacterium]
MGCGSGGLLVAAAGRGREIVGTDIALRWLIIARRRLADRGLVVPLIGASAERLPWPAGVFDAVVADSVLEHLDDPLTALREWARVVRPGGRLVLWSPNRHSLLADPHVGLWGVGWLPRPWADLYVRARRGCGWTIRPLNANEAKGLATAAGWEQVAAEAVEVPQEWARGRWERLAIRIYREALRVPVGRSLMRALGPLWQLTAYRGGAS